MLHLGPGQEASLSRLSPRRLDREQALVDALAALPGVADRHLHDSQRELRLTRGDASDREHEILDLRGAETIEIADSKRSEVRGDLAVPLDRALAHAIRMALEPALEELAERLRQLVEERPEAEAPFHLVLDGERILPPCTGEAEVLPAAGARPASDRRCRRHAVRGERVAGRRRGDRAAGPLHGVGARTRSACQDDGRLPVHRRPAGCAGASVRRLKRGIAGICHEVVASWGGLAVGQCRATESEGADVRRRPCSAVVRLATGRGGGLHVWTRARRRRVGRARRGEVQDQRQGHLPRRHRRSRRPDGDPRADHRGRDQECPAEGRRDHDPQHPARRREHRRHAPVGLGVPLRQLVSRRQRGLPGRVRRRHEALQGRHQERDRQPAVPAPEVPRLRADRDRRGADAAPLRPSRGLRRRLALPGDAAQPRRGDRGDPRGRDRAIVRREGVQPRGRARQPQAQPLPGPAPADGRALAVPGRGHRGLPAVRQARPGQHRLSRDHHDRREQRPAGDRPRAAAPGARPAHQAARPARRDRRVSRLPGPRPRLPHEPGLLRPHELRGADGRRRGRAADPGRDTGADHRQVQPRRAARGHGRGALPPARERRRGHQLAAGGRLLRRPQPLQPG